MVASPLVGSRLSSLEINGSPNREGGAWPSLFYARSSIECSVPMFFSLKLNMRQIFCAARLSKR